MALNLNPYQIKQLKTLINAYADNLAAQERVLRQLIVCLGLRDEPEQDVGLDKLRRLAERMPRHHEDAHFHIRGPAIQEEIRIMTKEEEAKYGHPIGSTLVSRVGGTEIWQVPCTDKTAIRPIVISGKGKGTWFVPCTAPITSDGAQMGVLCDNKYGLAVIENPPNMIKYPNQDIHEINSSLAKKPPEKPL